MPLDGANSNSAKHRHFQILGRMKNFLKDERRWTKRFLFQDVLGRETHHIKSAYGACLLGALILSIDATKDGTEKERLEGIQDFNTLSRVMDDVARSRGFHIGVAYFNNHPRTTHSDVLDFIDIVEKKLHAVAGT